MLAALREAVARRELLRSLVRREVSARYRGSALGFLWTLANPLLLLAVYGVIFGVVLNLRSSGASRAPYAVFLLAGLLAWNFVASTLSAATPSVVQHSGLVKKVRFPAEMLPLAQVGAGVINLGLAMAVLLVVVLVSVGASLSWLAVPFLVLALIPLVGGLAILLAVVNVYFRDVEHILGIALTGWFFLTPIVYPESYFDRLPSSWQWLPYLNPVTGWVVAFRHALLDGYLSSEPRVLWSLAYLLLGGVLLLVLAYALFVRLAGAFEEEL